MKPKTVEQLSSELAEANEHISKLRRELIDERRVLELLIAGGFVTEEKAEQARALLRP